MDGWSNEEKQAYQSTTINGKMSAKLYKRTVKWKKKKLKPVEKENAKFFVQDYFEKIWHKFDVDKDNVLNQVEFTNMV